jgi:hypothetical protein
MTFNLFQKNVGKPYSKSLYLCFSIVKLAGGSNFKEGNVYAMNPDSEMFGPVCDDQWTLENVGEK